MVERGLQSVFSHFARSAHVRALRRVRVAVAALGQSVAHRALSGDGDLLRRARSGREGELGDGHLVRRLQALVDVAAANEANGRLRRQHSKRAQKRKKLAQWEIGIKRTEAAVAPSCGRRVCSVVDPCD